MKQIHCVSKMQLLVIIAAIVIITQVSFKGFNRFHTKGNNGDCRKNKIRKLRLFILGDDI